MFGLGRIQQLFSAAGSVTGRVLTEAAGEALGKQVPKYIEHRVEGPPRAKLEADLLRLTNVEEHRRIIGFINAAVERGDDDRVVTQLVKFVDLPERDRKAVYRMIAHMTPEEFEHLIARLEHSIIPQRLTRLLKRLADLDRDAEILAKQLGVFADGLEPVLVLLEERQRRRSSRGV